MSSESIQCHQCGKCFDLPADYVAQHGGKSTQCECGAELPIPAPASAPRDPSACFWNDGGLVVVQQGAKLPRRCFKCNAPVTDQMKQVVLEWAPGKVVPRGVVGLIKNAIADAYGQSIIVRYGRCPDHRTSWTKFRVAGLFAAAAALVGAVGFSAVGAGWLPDYRVIGVLIACLACIAGAIIALRWGTPFRILKFEKKRAWVWGFADSYVNALPPYAQAAETDAAATAATADALGSMSAGHDGRA